MSTSTNRPTVVIFDVNETLLDLNGLKERVNRSLNSEGAFKLWFGLLLQYSLVDTLTENYHDFVAISGATLDMVAQMQGTNLEAEAKADILNAMKNLPPHYDVKEGLQLLKDAGFRLYALTNSPLSTLQQQLENSGLQSYFESALSVDEFKVYKPHPETYKKTLAKIGAQPEEAIMVAAHGWDIEGALKAGMQAAFIERKGQGLYPLAQIPQYTGKNIPEVAQRIINNSK